MSVGCFNRTSALGQSSNESNTAPRRGRRASVPGLERRRARSVRCLLAWRRMTSWMFRIFAVASLLALSAGCRHGDEASNPEPIEECRLYEAELGRCFHRTVSFANQPELVAAADGARERARKLCADNL